MEPCISQATTLGTPFEADIPALARGGWRAGRIREGSCVFPWLTVVRWRPADARRDHTVLLLPSMLDPEEFRRLRVLLRWG